ncbi:MAG: iron ABC transporter permease [Anaerolineaceae bacterium]|nr:iron ABC transporter permease [Anaerolineaceae bacterium]
MQKTTKPIWHTLRVGRFSFKQDRRMLPVFGVLLLLGIAILVTSVSYGDFDISPLDVLKTILGMDTGNSRHELVVFTFRLPRILVAFLVGSALSVSGTILQGITRNPLADPGILGVTAGASLAAVATIVWFDVPIEWLPFVAFGGALLMALTIFAVAWKGGSAPVRLILVGVGLGAVATALTNLMLVFGEINAVQEATVWLAGSVYGSNWQHVQTLVVWLIVLLTISILMARQLNTLGLGDDTARGLGLRVELQRVLLLAVSVALAAVAVAVAGTIGFVGLVAPHIARRLVGPSHEGLIPTAALLGGVLLMLADLIGRWVISPSELPVGVVAAMIGAPYFAYLLYQTRNK